MSTKRKSKYSGTKMALVGGSVLAFSALAGLIGAKGFTGAQASTTTTGGSQQQASRSLQPSPSSAGQPSTTQRQSSSTQRQPTQRQTTRVPVTSSRGS